jgi:hypothetical protein
MNEAKLLSSRHIHMQPHVVDGLPQSAGPQFLYVPLGFKPLPKGDGMVPTYPVGFSVFVLLVKPFTGWRHAGDLVIILHSLAGLVATYALGRVLGLRRVWAAVGAAIVAASPLYLFMSLQAMSDVPSLFWTTAAVLAALKARDSSRWALAAGCAIAIDVLLRPTNALAFIPVGIALGFSPRRWLLLVLGGLPGAIFFVSFNLAAYGRMVTTGYGDNFTFGANFIPETLLHYAHWIPALLTPIVVPVLGLPWVRGVAIRTRWLLGTWVAVFAALYAAYKCTHETWWYLRFLLPAVPPLVVGALIVWQKIISRIPFRSDSVRTLCSVGVALALVAANSVWWNRDLNSLGIGRGELEYGTLSTWLERNVEPNAVCLAMQTTGALLYYTDFTFIRYDTLTPGNVGSIEAAIRKSNRPLYAVLFPYEISEWHAIDRIMPGHWIQMEDLEGVTIWRREFDTPNLVLERPAYESSCAVEGPWALRCNPKNGYLVSVKFKPKEWWDPEMERSDITKGINYWRWSKGKSSVVINNPQPFSIFAEASFGLATLDSRNAVATIHGKNIWRSVLKPANENLTRITGIELPPGDTMLSIDTDRPPVRAGETDDRLVAFSVKDLKLEVNGRKAEVGSRPNLP